MSSILTTSTNVEKYSNYVKYLKVFTPLLRQQLSILIRISISTKGTFVTKYSCRTYYRLPLGKNFTLKV